MLDDEGAALMAKKHLAVPTFSFKEERARLTPDLISLAKTKEIVAHQQSPPPCRRI